MNAALLVDGHAKGGAPGARTALENFWRHVSEAARFSPLRRGPLDVLLGRWTLDSSPIYVAMDLMSRLVSPYDLNPMGKNPLRAILAETIMGTYIGASVRPAGSGTVGPRMRSPLGGYPPAGRDRPQGRAREG